MATESIKPLPFPVYFWSVTGVAIVGLLNMVYSSFSHYRVHTDMLYVSLCAVSEAVNCDTVSQSMYSIFMGMPVPVWGILGYGFFLILLSFAYRQEAKPHRIWLLLFLTALFFCIFSLFLAYILKFQIKVYCIVCLAGYGINFILLYLVWIIRRRFPEKGFLFSLKKDTLFLWRPWKKQTTVLVVFLLVMSIMPLVFPSYWELTLPDVTADLPSGMTEEGDPWIGAKNPELVITEFTDYMCFQCQKSHVYLRKIVEQNSDKIRLVHRHFPLDQEFNPIVTTVFHQGSGKLAVAAAYAAYEGKFWEMNDLLYDIPKGIKKLDIKTLAKQSGVHKTGLATALNNKRLRYKVKHDIAQGIKLGITGTPAYLIKGEIYQGRIPVNIIKKILEQ